MKRIFCDSNCKSGYFTDRRYGLIYGSWQWDDGTVKSWYTGSVLQGLCPYCQAPVVKYRKSSVDQAIEVLKLALDNVKESK